jgi:hypothetical protein
MFHENPQFKIRNLFSIVFFLALSGLVPPQREALSVAQKTHSA